MPDIPFQPSRVSSRTEGAEVLAPDVQDVFQAGENLSGTVSKVGFALAERSQALKEQADRSDYANEHKNLLTRIDEAKAVALQSGVHYQDIEEQIVSPMVKDFNDRLETRGYSRRSLSDIKQVWNQDSAIIAHNEATERTRMEMEDYVERIRKEADGLILDDPERAEERFDMLKGIVGEARVNSMKSSAYYGVYNTQMEHMERLYLEGQITPDEYKQYLDELPEKAKNDDNLEARHVGTISSIALSRGNNFIRREMSSLAQLTKKWEQAAIDGKLDYALNENLRRQMGDEKYFALEKASKDFLTGQATSNEDAREILRIMTDFNHSDPEKRISMTEAYRDIMSKGGAMAVAGIMHLNDSVRDMVERGEDVQAYEVFYKDQKVQTKGRMGDFLDSLASVTTVDMGWEDYNRRIQSAKIALANNPEMADDEWNKLKNDILKKDASEMIKKIKLRDLQSDLSKRADSLRRAFDEDSENFKPRQETSDGEVLRELPDGRKAYFNERTKEFIRYE